MLTKNWFVENDIGRKLHAAVEEIENGGAWDAFEGLQETDIVVKVSLQKGVIRFGEYRDPENVVHLFHPTVIDSINVESNNENTFTPEPKKKRSRKE